MARPVNGRVWGYCLAALGVLLILAGLPARSADGAPRASSLRVATFNALGASHTTGSGTYARWEDAATRTRVAVRVFDYRRLDVIALQEFQPAQQREFHRIASKRYGIWCVHDNCVAWRRATIAHVSHGLLSGIPYFHGTRKDYPIAVLRIRSTGQVFNADSIHNPADVAGDAYAWRVEGWARERSIEITFKLGDRNDTWGAYGKFLRKGEHPAGRKGIDFVVGSESVRFTSYHSIRTRRTERATDHPLVYADALIR
jgi:hypothetical protein